MKSSTPKTELQTQPKLETELVEGSPELSKIEAYWSEHEPVQDGGCFYLSPLLRPYIIETAYGRDWVAKYQSSSYAGLDIFVSKYLQGKKVETILSLCCGFGHVERRIVSTLHEVKYCLGLDLSEKALHKARQKAAAGGLHSISYERVDLNKYSWEREKFDLVLANGALHHLNQLEAVFEGIRRTLKPQGVLYSCEYVGPSYQDHSARQQQIINAAAFLVPAELRARKGLPFRANSRLFALLSKAYSVAARHERPEWSRRNKMLHRVLRTLLGRERRESDFGIVHVSPKDELLRRDPSECVRSSEIVPLVLNYFPAAEIRAFGGGILQHALDEKFYENFDIGNPLHTKCLEMLCELERRCMDSGEIGIENAFIIARK